MQEAIDRETALRLDARDPLGRFRERFSFPRDGEGRPVRYFTGNSLGLLCRESRLALLDEVTAWSERAVEGHFEGDVPWTTVHRRIREPHARVVGALPHETAVLGGLTVNLHLLMMSFYRPQGARSRILMETPSFPSDLYAVRTHLHARGRDPERELLQVAPPPGEDLLREDDIERVLEKRGGEIALVLLGGLHFLTGQWLDLPRIVAAAHRAGAVVGFDLAHAAGNVPLRLHDWNVDFAAWCTYKYLNAGPGAPGGVFVHERHARDVTLPRFGGWWGNDLSLRFRMQLEPEFAPVPEAEGWQISNPPILAIAPLLGSLRVFDEAGMDALRERSMRLTGYLERLLDVRAPHGVTVVTPRDPARRGAQLSLRVRAGSRAAQAALLARGVVCDFREPDIVRAAPVPLYTSFEDVWELADALAD